MTPAVDPMSDPGPASSAREPRVVARMAHWGWALSLQYSAQLKTRSLVMDLFKIKLSCRQKLRHEPSNEHVKCAVRTSLSRSGAKIVLSPARCGQDIGSITGS